MAIMAFAKQCAFLEVATSKIQFQEFNSLKLKIHHVSYTHTVKFAGMKMLCVAFMNTSGMGWYEVRLVLF